MPNLQEPVYISCRMEPPERVKSKKPASAITYFKVDKRGIFFFVKTKNFLPDTIELFTNSPYGEETILYHVAVPKGPRIAGRIAIESVSRSLDDFLNNLYKKNFGARLIHHGDEIIELSGILIPEEKDYGESGHPQPGKATNNTIQT
jgi:hypothetical protein